LKPFIGKQQETAEQKKHRGIVLGVEITHKMMVQERPQLPE
jgi:hypothetical protein